MIKRFLFLHACSVILSIGLKSQSILSDSITCNFDDLSFFDLALQLEDEKGLKIYFKEEWIKDISITQSGRCAVKDLLEQSLLACTLDYVFMQPDRIIIIPDSSFVREFPDLSMNEPGIRVADEKAAADTVDDNYIRGRQLDELCVLSVGNKSKQLRNRKSDVSGLLADAEDYTPLIGATVFIPELDYGTATDSYGRLSLSLNPGEYSVEFRCLGMTEAKCVLNVLSDGEFTYYLKRDRKQLEAVTVVAEYDFQIGGEEIGMEKLNLKQIKELPSFMGEKDVVKIAQLLPGVVSISEASSGINVRGGNADQNMFYLNDIALYNTSHAFGFFSAINAGLIRDFSIHKGYVPPRYGGRLSSIFLIESRKGIKEKLFAQGGISPLSANLVLEIPVIAKKFTLAMSGRASFSNWIMNRLPDENLKNSSVSFNDFALSGTYRKDEKNTAKFMLYNSNDSYSLSSLNEVNYSNLGSEFVWEHRFNPKIKSKQSLTYSRYTSGSRDKSNPVSAYSHSYGLNHTAVNSAFLWRMNQKHLLNLGVNMILYNLNRGEVEPLGEESQRIPSDLGRDNGIEGALFFEDEYRITSKLTLNAGLRYSFYAKYGPDDVHSYFEDQAPSKESIADTRVYKRGERVVSYGRPGLRLAAAFKVNRSNSLKVAYNELSQYIFSLSNSYSVAPSDQWKLCDSYIKPGFSRQASLAFYHDSPRPGIGFSLETYVKRMNNILEFQDGADFIETKNTETVVVQGQQDACGFELMLSKERGNIQGWLSYAFSRSFIIVDGENPWEEINNGLRYPSNYDKPHVLNFVGNYRFNKRFVFSANVVYSTGRPITLPQTAYYINSNQYVEYSNRNEFRLADYFRLDMSLSMEGNLKKKKPFHSFWMLNIYNVTGRENPYSIYFSSVEGQLKGFKYSIIGVPVVTVSWNFKLGNYNNG